MPAELASFTFIVSLAAVINGLGIVRWLNGLAEFLQLQRTIQVRQYWVYTLAASFQFILHILLWWSLWSVRGADNLNFLTYLYLLAGPILMFLGTAFLAPPPGDDALDLKDHYEAIRPRYTTILIAVWIWAIFTAPVFRGHFAETAPMYAAFLAVAVVRRITRNSRVQAAAALINWALLAVFVVLYAMHLGGSAPGLD